MKEFMMDSPQSHLSLLLEGLSERIRDLNREFEHLYVKVELTLDLWRKIEKLSQQEGREEY